MSSTSVRLLADGSSGTGTALCRFRNILLDGIIIIIIIIIIQYVFLLSQAFLPGTSLEPAVIPTAQASNFTLQYFPYYV